MAATFPTLHIVFSRSAAANLRQALAGAHPRDRVVAFTDDLSFGPITPLDPGRRAEWVATELRHASWPAGFKDERARATTRRHKGPFVVWMSRRSAREHAGFLEFACRTADRPFGIVDLTGTSPDERGSGGFSDGREPIESLDRLSAGQILRYGYLNRIHTAGADAREGYRRAWLTLRQEDAPLRVLDRQFKLVSAPITFFDQQLLAFTQEGRWLKAARIIGNLLTLFENERRYQTGDFVPTARLHALAELGRLEKQGNLSRIRHSEVRRVRGD